MFKPTTLLHDNEYNAAEIQIHYQNK